MASPSIFFDEMEETWNGVFDKILSSWISSQSSSLFSSPSVEYESILELLLQHLIIMWPELSTFKSLESEKNSIIFQNLFLIFVPVKNYYLEHANRTEQDMMRRVAGTRKNTKKSH